MAILIRGGTVINAGYITDEIRNKGVKDTLKEARLADKIEWTEQYADFSRAKAQSVAESILAKSQDYDFVIANGDDMILGALGVRTVVASSNQPPRTNSPVVISAKLVPICCSRTGLRAAIATAQLANAARRTGLPQGLTVRPSSNVSQSTIECSAARAEATAIAGSPDATNA